ncbi:hypothetical protein, partial [Anaerosolibacter sp.]|uniref:hypothetical protein n=1 Tax=Anaerosolibacter sp. TaxID=1872527 RepID=UPI0039F12BBE
NLRRFCCKKLLVFLIVFALAFSASFTSFAESVQLNTSSEITESDIVTIQNALERPNPDGTPAQNTNNKSKDSNSTESISFNTITPFFIRSGDTERVQVYLNYSGTDPANAIKFTSLKINSPSLIFPTTYGSFPAKTYNFGVVSTNYNVYIGNVNIPTTETKVRVSDSGVMAYQIDYGWSSFTNMIGEWPIL